MQGRATWLYFPRQARITVVLYFLRRNLCAFCAHVIGRFGGPRSVVAAGWHYANWIATLRRGRGVALPHLEGHAPSSPHLALVTGRPSTEALRTRRSASLQYRYLVAAAGRARFSDRILRSQPLGRPRGRVSANWRDVLPAGNGATSRAIASSCAVNVRRAVIASCVDTMPAAGGRGLR